MNKSTVRPTILSRPSSQWNGQRHLFEWMHLTGSVSICIRVDKHNLRLVVEEALDLEGIVEIRQTTNDEGPVCLGYGSIEH